MEKNFKSTVYYILTKAIQNTWLNCLLVLTTIEEKAILTPSHGQGCVTWVCWKTFASFWVMQQDNNNKNISKSTSEWLKSTKMNVLKWPRWSPDLNPNEMLWRDLQTALHEQMLSNINEPMSNVVIIERQKFLQNDARYWYTSRKCLLQVIVAKCCSTCYWLIRCAYFFPFWFLKFCLLWTVE